MFAVVCVSIQMGVKATFVCFKKVDFHMHGSFEGKKTFTTRTVGLILSGRDLMFETQGHKHSVCSSACMRKELREDRTLEYLFMVNRCGFKYSDFVE